MSVTILRHRVYSAWKAHSFPLIRHRGITIAISGYSTLFGHGVGIYYRLGNPTSFGCFIRYRFVV